MKKQRRGTVYPRGNILWIQFYGPDGKLMPPRSTGLKVGQEKKAAQVLDRIIARIATGADLGEAELGALTVEMYTKRWLERRKKQGLSSAKINAYQLAHVLPRIGSIKLEALDRSRIRDLVTYLLEHGEKLRGKGKLGPRTVRHSYFTLKTMLEDAVIDGFLDVNPCTLKTKRGELPKSKDKDPLWRRDAKFSRQELELLLVHPTIPEFRRVWYAVATLAGLRFGEIAAARWRMWDPETEPMGRLDVFASFDSNNRREKEDKTDNPRAIPVHAALARILAEWKLNGWPKLVGRVPRPDDLILPVHDAKTNQWTFRHKNEGWQEQCVDIEETLGWRHRRQHDFRRTFVSLARADGARPDLLRWVSHGPPKGAMIDEYTSPPWETLCEQVSCLKLSLRKGSVVELPKKTVVGGGEIEVENLNDIARPSPHLLQSLLQSGAMSSKIKELSGWGTRTRSPICARL